VRQRAQRLKSSDNLYLVRVNSKLRLIFKYESEVVEVLDVVTHDRLERMYKYARG